MPQDGTPKRKCSRCGTLSRHADACRAGQRAVTAARRALGLCTRCSGSRAEGDGRTCFACFLSKKFSQISYAEKCIAEGRCLKCLSWCPSTCQRYARRAIHLRAQGLCLRCARPLDPVTKQCKPCKISRSFYKKRKKETRV